MHKVLTGLNVGSVPDPKASFRPGNQGKPVVRRADVQPGVVARQVDQGRGWTLPGWTVPWPVITAMPSQQ